MSKYAKGVACYIVNAPKCMFPDANGRVVTLGDSEMADGEKLWRIDPVQELFHVCTLDIIGLYRLPEAMLLPISNPDEESTNRKDKELHHA